MKFRTEERLVRFAVLVLLVGLCAFGYLTLSSNLAYSFAVVGLLGVGWVIVKMGNRSAHRRDVEMLRLAFAASGLPVPKLEGGNSYEFRSITLTFSSEAELRQAEALGCIAAFKQAVQMLYMHTGSKQKPFNADKAVWATYIGWKPSISSR